MNSQQNALEFRKVYFNYKSECISTLTGINLTVPKGVIYGLLGSSGCGKTTLLRCALGRLTPQSGTISLFGKRPGSRSSQVPGPGVGYMPQELALYVDFSIEETLQYFGRLFGINSETVEQRVQFMINLLQLPKRNKLIKELSGGQQRRVSLATALFHSPPLLILDEPTVGVDPILREAIWKHLENLCKTGLTVILTTHYVEEARTAQVVGFMRSGKLLAEQTPEQLLKIHGLKSLESVFLKLCRVEENQIFNHNFDFQPKEIPKIEINDENSNSNSDNETEIPSHELNSLKNLDISNNEVNGHINFAYKASTSSLELINVGPKNIDLPNGYIPVKQENIISETNFLSRMHALTRKNFKQLSRNSILLLFFVLLPSVEISLLIMCIGQDVQNIPVSVYNADKDSDLSELFLKCIDSKQISLIRFKSFDSAITAVKLNQVWAAIYFNKDFSESLRMRQILITESDQEILNSSSIRLTLDMSNQVIGFQIQRLIFEAFLKFIETLANRTGINPEALKPPIIIDPPVYGVRKPSLTSFIAPGALIVVAYFATTVVTCHLLIKERSDGLVERSLVAGVTALEFVLSHIILQIIMLIIQVGLKLMIAFVIFTIPNSGSIITAIALILMQGICGLMFGLMISAACPNEIYATTLGIGAFFPSVIIGGIFWPVESMPNSLRYISYILPSTLPIESLRCILLRGWGITYHQVLIGFVVTILWFTFFLINAVNFFMRKL